MKSHISNYRVHFILHAVWCQYSIPLNKKRQRLTHEPAVGVTVHLKSKGTQMTRVALNWLWSGGRRGLAQIAFSLSPSCLRCAQKWYITKITWSKSIKRYLFTWVKTSSLPLPYILKAFWGESKTWWDRHVSHLRRVIVQKIHVQGSLPSAGNGAPRGAVQWPTALGPSGR